MAALLTRRPRGTPIKELMEEFGACRSTVFRYLKKAREAGVLQGPQAHEERLGT